MIVDKGGVWWPEKDIHCFQAILNELTHIQHIMPLVTETGACVQAGGNVGHWAKELAKLFTDVYTFEPQPENFSCLERNCTENNIHKLNAALGAEPGNCSINMPEDNCGAGYVEFTGGIPVITIDGLGLENIGLIQLDIEGMELPALKGAEETIKKFSPVICVELKRLGVKYGYEDTELRKFLHDLGYAEARQVDNDYIFTRSRQ